MADDSSETPWFASNRKKRRRRIFSEEKSLLEMKLETGSFAQFRKRSEPKRRRTEKYNFPSLRHRRITACHSCDFRMTLLCRQCALSWVRLRRTTTALLPPKNQRGSKAGPTLRRRMKGDSRTSLLGTFRNGSARMKSLLSVGEKESERRWCRGR